MPKKPNRPLCAIKFAKDESVEILAENTDLEQGDLELSIATKFFDSIQRYCNISISNVRRAAEPGDLCGDTTDGKTIDVQIAEVVDRDTISLDEAKKHLSEALSSDTEILSLFEGCRLILYTADNAPPPASKSPAGREFYLRLKSELHVIGRSLDKLEVGQSSIKELVMLSPAVCCSIERLAMPGNGLPATIRIGGGAAISDTNWLLETTRAKVGKNYTKPENEFWLLQYSSDVVLGSGDKEIIETASYLDTTKHPFDKVWFFIPFPKSNNGVTIRVWPRPANLSVEPPKPSGKTLAKLRPSDVIRPTPPR